MRYCILGAGNCYALNLAHYLRGQGHEVFGIGRSPLRSDCWTGGNPYESYQVLHINEKSGIVAHEASYSDVIVNFAAQGEGAASFDPETWHYFFDTNCSGLAKVIGWLVREKWQGRFIHVGSSEVYGSVFTPASEEHPIKPSSPYSASKAAFDLFLQSIHHAKGFNTVIVRPSNCYCPGQQLHRIIPMGFRKALNGERLKLHGRGVAEKSYLHATDLARAVERIADNGESGKIYNVGPDLPISIRDLVALIANKCSVAFEDLVEEAPDRVGQDAKYWLTCRPIKNLGWEPEITLDQGLDEMHKWVKDNLEELNASPQEFKIRP